MNLRERVVRGSLWSLLGGNASQLLAVAFFLVISRLVGPHAFGLVAIAIILLEIGRYVITESLASTLVAKPTCQTTDYDAAMPIALAVSACIGASLFLLAPTISQLYQIPELTGVLRALAWLAPIQAATRLQEAWLTRQMQFKALAARAVFATFMGGIAGVVAALQGWGAYALVTQQIATTLCSFAVTFWGSSWRPALQIDPPRFRSLWSAATTLTPAALMSSLSNMLDGLAAGVSGAAAAGIYGLAKRIRLAMQFAFASALTRATLPALAQAGERGRRRHMAAEILQLTMLGSCGIFLSVAAMAPELISLLLDDRWTKAALPLTILLIAAPFAIATTLFDALLLIAERRKAILALKGAAFALLVTLLFAAATHGAAFIASASLATAIYNNAAYFWVSKELHGLSIQRYAYFIGAPLLLGLTAIAAVTFLRDVVSEAPLLARIVFLGVIVMVIYCGGALVLMRPVLLNAYASARAIVGPRT